MSRAIFMLLMFSLCVACNHQLPGGKAASSNNNGADNSLGQELPSAQCPAQFSVVDAYRMGCQKDADCVSMKADCCGCAAGGQQTAVLRAYEKEALACAQRRCADTMCALMYGCNDSAKAVCDAGLCTLR